MEVDSVVPVQNTVNVDTANANATVNSSNPQTTSEPPLKKAKIEEQASLEEENKIFPFVTEEHGSVGQKSLISIGGVKATTDRVPVEKEVVEEEVKLSLEDLKVSFPRFEMSNLVSQKAVVSEKADLEPLMAQNFPAKESNTMK